MENFPARAFLAVGFPHADDFLLPARHSHRVFERRRPGCASRINGDVIFRGEISEEIFVAAVRCTICSRCCVLGQSRSPEGAPEGGGETPAGAPGVPEGEAKSPKILTMNSEGGIYAFFAPAKLAYL